MCKNEGTVHFSIIHENMNNKLEETNLMEEVASTQSSEGRRDEKTKSEKEEQRGIKEADKVE